MPAPNSIRTSSELKWKAVGLVGFFGPFSRGCFGGTQCTRLGLASKLARWRNRFDDFGSHGLRSHAGARFQSDHVRQSNSGRLLHQRPRDGSALGLIFSPFTKQTLLLAAISLVSLLIFAFRDAPVLRTSRGRASELEATCLLFRLFGPGSKAVWSGNEAVLPAYIIGMVLAGCAGKIIF